MTARIDKRVMRVVIAGGGVAAVEALLALRADGPDEIEPILLAPGPDFVYPPLAVAEPFGAADRLRVPLAKIAADTEAALRPDAFAGVDPNRRLAQTSSGDTIEFDSLLIAVGARRLGAIPGAITYRGGRDNPALENVVSQAERGRVRQLVFAVPASVSWPFAIYDLALLCAARLRQSGSSTRISLVTHEADPLALFGRRASMAVKALLDEAQVVLRPSMTPVRVERGALVLASGSRIAADRVIALPRLAVPGLVGIPQGPEGFIGTDRHMRVEGLGRVYAVGDATWFPIKQGGVAAQQADAAVSAIATLVDPEREPRPFKPILRGALLTGTRPLFLRTSIGARDQDSAASDEPLWWPPSKIAGNHLAGYLRDLTAKTEVGGQLEDLDEPHGGDPAAASEHREAVELALKAADLDAADGDFRGALRWLQVVEDLEIALPTPYGARRGRWRQWLAPDATGAYHSPSDSDRVSQEGSGVPR